MDSVLIVVSVLLLLGLVLVAMRDGDRRREDGRQLRRRLALIERRLQHVVDHLGVAEPDADMPDVVRRLEEGDKIQAIKAYRDATGAGLAEAKDAVESMARQRGL